MRVKAIGDGRKERRGVKAELDDESVLEMGHEDGVIEVEVGTGIGLDKNAMVKMIERI